MNDKLIYLPLFAIALVVSGWVFLNSHSETPHVIVLHVPEQKLPIGSTMYMGQGTLSSQYSTAVFTIPFDATITKIYAHQINGNTDTTTTYKVYNPYYPNLSSIECSIATSSGNIDCSSSGNVRVNEGQQFTVEVHNSCSGELCVATQGMTVSIEYIQR